MGKRPWRRFDWMLLGALLLLSAYGVIMIYSATIDTPGVGDPVQRQSLYLGVGTALLLIVASVDYRLLEILQHPLSFLTPLVLGLLNVAAVAAWQIKQTKAAALTASLLAPVVTPLAIGLVLILFVFAVDRAWLARSDQASSRSEISFRGLIFIGVLAVAGMGALLITRLGPARLPALIPYLFGLGLSCAVSARLPDAARYGRLSQSALCFDGRSVRGCFRDRPGFWRCTELVGSRRGAAFGNGQDRAHRRAGQVPGRPRRANGGVGHGAGQLWGSSPCRWC